MTVAVAPPTGACVACGGVLDRADRPFPGGRPQGHGEVHTCRACGSAQLMPRPSPAEVAALYSQDYFESYIAGPGVKGGTETVAPALRARLREAERRLGHRGRLVDAGCAYGLFVAHAQSEGWDAVGVEPSEWAAQEGRRRFGVTIHACDLASAPIEPASVDVVHANHVLEHLLDPVATLSAAARILRPGGWLVIEVPQELRRPVTDRIYGTLHPSLYPARPPDPTHLEFFSAAGLRRVAERAGLVPESIRTVRHEPNLSSRLPLGGAAKALLVRVEEVAGTAPDLVLWARRHAT